jgi:hypothetical protein
MIENKTARYELLDWIEGFVIFILVFFVYTRMMMYWIPVGTFIDILVRRFLFLFGLTFLSGIPIAVRKYKSPSEEWLIQKPWFTGVIWGLLIEGFSLDMQVRTLHVGTYSEVLHKWISQWWIILIAIAIGVAGRYVGQIIGQKWRESKERKQGN